MRIHERCSISAALLFHGGVSWKRWLPLSVRLHTRASPPPHPTPLQSSPPFSVGWRGEPTGIRPQHVGFPRGTMACGSSLGRRLDAHRKLARRSARMVRPRTVQSSALGAWVGRCPQPLGTAARPWRDGIWRWSRRGSVVVRFRSELGLRGAALSALRVSGGASLLATVSVHGVARRLPPTRRFCCGNESSSSDRNVSVT